ncbi:kynurenine formamidase [Anopheles marshallii]|uniref:kynurenine formamidase n=1 Tax=Anopheles marshallii TaxID=1521116 RepID=UPI00237C30B6|nr:kynurenine formamidase [Anopheles marshallii]
MAKQIITSASGGLITPRSVIGWAVFVVCFAFVANHHQLRLTVAAEEPPSYATLWFYKLARYVRNSNGRLSCTANMDGQGPPSESTLAIWEKQYSPSAWSVRFPTPSEVIDYHVSFAKNVTDANKAKYETTLDVPYSSGERDMVDIYGDNLPLDAPLFVYIHGGYWQQLEKESSGYAAKPLIDGAMRVMIVGYELCPSVTLEELVRQIKFAGEFVLNYATENGVKHISIAGHSAGAHLILSMLDESFQSAVGEELNLLKDVYLISGVYNVQELRYTRSVNNGNLLGINDDNAKRLSPMFANYDHLRSTGIKFHVYAGQHDSDVFRDMSSKMNDRLKSFGLSSDLNVLPNLDHFDIVEHLASSDYTITKAILEGASRAYL